MPLNVEQATDQELFGDTFEKLKEGVLKQGAAQRRVAVRVKYLIRSITVAIVTSLLFIFYLIHLLTRQVDVLTEQLDVISVEGERVLHSVRNIDTVMMKFEAQMNTLPDITDSVVSINQNLSLVTRNVAGVSDNIGTINREVYELRQTMNYVSQNIQKLEYTVYQVNQDVNSATKPIKRFNDLNPFNYLR